MSKDESLHSFIAAVNELYKPVQGRDTGFDVDFQSLKRLSANLKQSKDHESLQGQKLENKKKNRYKDILPFDYTRVKLNVVDEDPNSDYINASFIKGAEGHKNYIASQGPLPHTVNDFWQMLWQYNVTVVVMVCREFEMGKKKCERYWSEKGESKEFGNITVTLSDKEDLKDGYCLRTIKVQRGSESRNIQQFHYTSWPDHGVPKTCYEILTLINHVRDIQSYAKDEMTPLCVHCSAGCGRTGAVLAVDYVRNLLAEDKVSIGLRTYDIIAEMRKQRPAIVQTRDQYEFVNAAILEMFQIYMQTRTVSYKGFSTGYEQGDYVNINLSTASHNGTVEPKTTNSTRPTNLSYENIDMVRKHQNIKTLPSPKAGIGKANSIDDSPGPPPAKPSRTAGNNVRPVSMMIPPAAAHQNNLPGNPSTLKRDMVGGRKQSAPAIGCTPLQPKTNANNIVRSPLMPLGPLVGKEVSKPVPPKPLAKPKVNSPQPPAKPKLTKVDSGSKPILGGRLSGEGGAMKPPVTPKTNVASLSPTDAQKAKPPTKPRRTVKASQSPIPPPKLKNVADGPELYSTSSKPTPGKFTKYNKTHLYNDVIPGGKTEDNQKNVVESAYEDFDNTAVRRSSSASSVDRPQTPSGRNKAPPKLPARTPESQIVLTEAPPSLPTRTPESYLTIEDICKLRRNTIAGEEDEELQTYEAVQHSSNNFDGKSHSEDRLSTSTPTGGSGSTSLAAKTKGFLEKTSNVFSKVGASIAKTNDDASHARPSTIDKRTPTYTPGPTVHSGQDMSFGKRLMKKVKGGRTFPNK